MNISLDINDESMMMMMMMMIMNINKFVNYCNDGVQGHEIEMCMGTISFILVS